MAYNVYLAAKRGNPRALARLAGEATYMPEKPCTKGHLDWRYTKHGQCRQCVKNSKNAARAIGKYKETDKAYQLKYGAENRKRQRTKNYGLSVEQFDKMLVDQNNQCKICQVVLDGGKKTHIDHCHETGLIRGLLCNHCNIGIGHFKHSPELLIKAAEYCK